MTLDVQALRTRFPALTGSDLVPLDNAATTHRPEGVLEALRRFYVESNANVHRADHRLGQAATDAYEGARGRVARFLGAAAEEVVFTRNATEAVNLVARGFLEPRLQPGDVVVVTALEHHSNLVPWQQVCARTGARLAVLPVDDRGRLVEPELPVGTVFVAATRVSNAIGTIVDTADLVGRAHAAGAQVLLDVTQAVGHLPLDEGTRAADFLALSGHKTYGPMGVGVLRGRAELLEHTEPLLFGGEMVDEVGQHQATWLAPPRRFEAGTPAVAPAVALAPALDLLDEVGLEAVRAHELALLEQLLAGLAGLDGLELVGPPTAAERSGAVSLRPAGGGDVHVMAAVLDMAGVAARAGWHCAEPLLRGLGGPTLRLSVALYSTPGDIERALGVLPEALSACR